MWRTDSRSSFLLLQWPESPLFSTITTSPNPSNHPLHYIFSPLLSASAAVYHPFPAPSIPSPLATEVAAAAVDTQERPSQMMRKPFDLSSIRSDSVRLIDQQQKMVGIVSKAQAIQMADDAELDLVILSPEADPPVVRIMDFNYNIDVHDYSVRLKAARRFLKDGDKVKVIVNLKGRENEFRNKAIELLRRFQNDIGELGIEENKDFRDRNIFVVLVPNKAVAQRSQEPAGKKDNPSESEVSAGV
ncbi:Translation initiation factor 3 protein isoform 1 [Dorcoceras hygrometricum]|uniref:Translation initiation factor 3 protein isoform 1 n=1 Tax=Dorcoceras hygrometricum TaxID=472368 RepID=A0A2Z7BTG5_9LAMI|nr:Translation initiation factor 3 protein isoform 1 [Dorcoceras hygrometricum]